MGMMAEQQKQLALDVFDEDEATRQPEAEDLDALDSIAPASTEEDAQEGQAAEAGGDGAMRHPPPRQPPPAASRRPKRIWIAGTVTFIVGSVINFVAFVFAAAAVLAPLEAVQFVSNLLFARFVCKKRVSRQAVVGSGLVVAGVVGAVTSGPMAVYKFSTAQLMRFWRDPVWIATVIAVWSLSLALQAFWHVQQRKVLRGGKALGPPLLMPVCYAVSSALIGTQSVVQAKAFSELVEVTLCTPSLHPSAPSRCTPSLCTLSAPVPSPATLAPPAYPWHPTRPRLGAARSSAPPRAHAACCRSS